MRPVGGFGGRLAPTDIVAHVLLVERPDGLLLVDTGFGVADIASPARLGTPFVKLMRPSLNLAETALRQVEALGYAGTDVRDIVLTHMDLDHAGGISDFPAARIHVDAMELEAARNPKLSERARYVSAQWAHGPEFVPHAVAGESWLGFDSVRAVGDDVLLVPLRGHSRGHSGVAVRSGDSWVLHAGDSYFFHGEVETPPRRKPGLTAFQAIMSVEEKKRRHNQSRLRTLVADHPEVTVFSAHDKVEYARTAR